MINENTNMNTTNKLLVKQGYDQTSSEDERSSIHSSICGTDDERSSDEKGIVKTVPLGKQVSNNALTQHILRLSNPSSVQTIQNLKIENSTNVRIGNEINVEIMANVRNKRRNIKKLQHSKNQSKVSSSSESTDDDEDSEEYIGNEGFLNRPNKSTSKFCLDGFVQRKMWVAQAPMIKYNNLRKPIGIVSVSHTETESSLDKSTNIKTVRELQCQQIESLKLGDIAYNFLIGCDGLVYEGRGWNAVGAHSQNFNKLSVGIAFIGNFVKDPPTKEAIEAFQDFLKRSVEQNLLREDYKVLCYSSPLLTKTLPSSINDLIKTWDHYFDLQENTPLRNKIMPETMNSKVFNTIRIQIAWVFNVIQDFFTFLFRGRLTPKRE